MFDQIFKCAATIERYRAAPLRQSRVSYLSHWAEQGAKPLTLRRLARAQLMAIHYLDLGAEGGVSRAALSEAVSRWARRNTGRRGPSAQDRAAFARQVAGWLRFAGRLESSAKPRSRNEDRVEAYVQHMLRERGCSASTMLVNRGRVAEFLRHIEGEGLALADVEASTVDDALRRKAEASGCSRVTLAGHATALRSFFRYAESRSWCQAGIAESIVAPRIYRLAGLPSGPSREEVRSLIATTDGDRPASVRDRAILLLLSVCGLRAGEVRRLRLEDIDWDAGTLCLRNTKNGRSRTHPLGSSVGAALIRYLREVRPSTAWREVFLTVRAPVRPMCGAGIPVMVRWRMRKAGIEGPRRGAHSLRHAFAQHLLAEGFSMHEIGECLGHRCPTATAVYAKVDLASLRQVADIGLEGLA